MTKKTNQWRSMSIEMNGPINIVISQKPYRILPKMAIVLIWLPHDRCTQNCKSTHMRHAVVHFSLLHFFIETNFYIDQNICNCKMQRISVMLCTGTHKCTHHSAAQHSSMKNLSFSILSNFVQSPRFHLFCHI